MLFLLLAISSPSHRFAERQLQADCSRPSFRAELPQLPKPATSHSVDCRSAMRPKPVSPAKAGTEGCSLTDQLLGRPSVVDLAVLVVIERQRASVATCGTVLVAARDAGLQPQSGTQVAAFAPTCRPNHTCDQPGEGCGHRTRGVMGEKKDVVAYDGIYCPRHGPVDAANAPSPDFDHRTSVASGVA